MSSSSRRAVAIASLFVMVAGHRLFIEAGRQIPEEALPSLLEDRHYEWEVRPEPVRFVGRTAAPRRFIQGARAS